MVCTFTLNNPKLTSMKRSLYLLIALVLMISVACQKEGKVQEQDPTAPVDKFEDLQVSSNFNWSASTKEAVTIHLEDTTGLKLDGQQLQLITQKGDLLDVQSIDQDKAYFFLHYPQDGAQLYYYLPATGEKWAVKGTDQTLELASLLSRDAPRSGKNNRRTKSAAQGANLLTNGDFEINDFGQSVQNGYGAPAPQKNRWYSTDNEFEWKNAGGSYRIENKDGQGGFATAMFQTVDITSGKAYKFTAQVKGMVFIYIMALDANGRYLGYSYSSNNSGTATLSTRYDLPTNATQVNALIYMRGYSTDEWADEAELIEVGSDNDSDGDGVNDPQDAFPNDPQAAYIAQYPSSGRQTVAFEDLWPAKGDYDFNDLVASARFEIIKNASQDITKVRGKVAIEALGAGRDNGLGINFKILNSTGIRRLSRGVLGTVSGNAQKDPRNQSGIILYQRPSDVLQPVYSNTQGNFTTPDTLSFEVNFSARLQISALVPQFFIFRSNDRSHEIHLPGQSPTAAFNTNLSNTADDAGGYRTANGHPWGLELVTPADQPFRFPKERVDIINAYSNFQAWATSQGSQKTDWYNAPVSSKVISRGN